MGADKIAHRTPQWNIFSRVWPSARNSLYLLSRVGKRDTFEQMTSSFVSKSSAKKSTTPRNMSTGRTIGASDMMKNSPKINTMTKNTMDINLLKRLVIGPKINVMTKNTMKINLLKRLSIASNTHVTMIMVLCRNVQPSKERERERARERSSKNTVSSLEYTP